MNTTQTQPALKAAKRRRRPTATPTQRAKNCWTSRAKIFADRGYHAATIREICDAAGANIAAVNYHFGDKLALYTEVVHQSMRMAELEAMQNALNQHAPPRGHPALGDSRAPARHHQARPAGLVLPHPDA